MKNETLFKTVRFLFTPVRKAREYKARRKMAYEFIRKYAQIKKTDKKIFYFGIPEHNNLGDIAQTYCTKKWISENYPERQLLEARTRVTFDKKFIDFIVSILNKDDIFLFQSGYCTRHRNPDHLMHLHIAKVFPDNKLVILPQTVKLNDQQDIETTKNVFSKCSRLCFITRDRQSFEFAKSFVPAGALECFPDIVTSLIGRVTIEGKRNGVMLCVRNDDEKFYSDRELNELKQKLGQYFDRVDRTDTNSDKTAQEVYKNLEPEINTKLAQFSNYECVITDRYHGTIFSLVANTPVIVIKTNDHKVTSAVEWFERLYNDDAIRSAGSLDQALNYAAAVCTQKPVIANSDALYKKYYENKLFELIESL